MNPQTLENTATKPAVEKLAYTGPEVEQLLGGISGVTRWRLEKRGLLKRIPGIAKPLYSRKSVMAFINGEVTA